MIKNFSDSNKLAKYLANEILELLQKKNKCVLGCPGGRSLTKTYYQLGRISHKKKISLENLTIVMMDEYVLKRKNSFSLVDPKSHFSCVRFSNQVIKRLLNYKKRKNHKITNERILFPNVLDPAKYDHQIKNIGGIDIFLLASGSSDGHVAFNNIYSKRNQNTHITKLTKETRRDNMKTFPNFKSINEVPKYGLTVGLNTISALSKSATLVLTGNEKKYAFSMITQNAKFNSKWPASIIYKCKKYRIFTDKLSNLS